MNDDVKMQEQLSALADGQLKDEEFAQAMVYAATESGRAHWHAYHVIGDVLRSSELAAPHSVALLDRVRAQIAQEPHPADLASGELTQVVAVKPADSRVANSGVFQWKLAAGFASLAAVAAIGWNAYTGLQAPAGGQLAAAPLTVVPAQPVAVAERSSNGQPVMIRDPRLDELLAAHKQFGSTTTLQMPAGFLRNATFEAPAR
ncbi:MULTISPECIES: sigma-E factor negative regulatory protein [unclassified Acidovorax]|uniref:sigma-E factor negative regulatory protein n=1 Tax=unclassified Acidovorax TaxID=2684926 RepID=UPI002882DE5D|nr:MULTISPECIES: sigma-E factor negative regulatory protein [unclassified Acidovorax]